MAHFTAYDGTDSNGVRAEVKVMTGSAVIKEIVENDTSRNAEIVFIPDNPMLKRKVGGFVDKEKSVELYEYAKKALAEKITIEYRIESQRKRKVDRTIKFDELKPTDDVIRIVASLDKVRSAEAITNPKEDPKESPTGRFSALDEELNVPASAPASNVSNAGSSVIDKETILEALGKARKEGISHSILDALVAQALISGANYEEISSAGFDDEDSLAISRQNQATRVAANEEKPWNAFNSDGRANAGAYMVTHAATAEQFALDHLILIYSQTGSKTSKATVQVTDQMISQAASIALQILAMADEVQTYVTASRANRQKNSYGRALNLVIDAIAKRFNAPIGGNQQSQDEWHTSIVSEASERLYGVMEVAHGRIPLSLKERGSSIEESKSDSSIPPKVEVTVVAKETPQVNENAEETKSPKEVVEEKVSTLAQALGGKVRIESKEEVITDSSEVKQSFPKVGEEGFLAPAPSQVARLKELCIKADIMGQNEVIKKWLETNTGSRTAKEIHSAALEAWLTQMEPLTKEELQSLIASLV